MDRNSNNNGANKDSMENEKLARRKEELVRLVQQLADDTSLHGFKQIHDNKGSHILTYFPRPNQLRIFLLG